MNMTKLASVCAASAMALALFEATTAEAGPKPSFASSNASRTLVAQRPKQATVVKKKVVTKKAVTKKVVTKKVVTKKITTTPKLVTKAPSTLISKGVAPNFVAKSGVKFGAVKLGNLPIHKAVASSTLLKGRLGVPQNVKPKLTLTLAPKQQFQLRMSPFIQKHWKKSFFWVAVAGLGYITIPELYYDSFMGYVNLDDPDYDACIRLLSYAALEDEEYYMVREPMPPTAVYRYSAKTAPPPKEVALSPQEGGTACALTPFVERRWNRAFVWVQVPETGNVTVPEDYYDRFYGHVSGEPPNFLGACQVLVEAAAADMMATTSLDVKRSDYN